MVNNEFSSSNCEAIISLHLLPSFNNFAVDQNKLKDFLDSVGNGVGVAKLKARRSFKKRNDVSIFGSSVW